MNRPRHSIGALVVALEIIAAIALIAVLYMSDRISDKKDRLEDDEDFVYEHVIIIGVDGAGANFADVNMPNLSELVSNGIVSYRVLTSEPTISAQCWGSLMTGVPPETHGLTNSIIANTPYDTKSDHPTIFRMVREHDPDADMASFCGWEPINIGIIEEDIGVYKGSGTDEEVTEMACDYINKNDPKLMFVHFEEVDATGHADGYCTEKYYQQLSVTDGYIGRIYNALKQRDMLDTTLFIVTADHGGVENGHGGSSDEEKYVMYLAMGKTVRKGRIIGDMSIRDNAAIVLEAFGYDQPNDWPAHVPVGIF